MEDNLLGVKDVGWGQSPQGTEDAEWGRSHRELGNTGIDGDPQGSGNIANGVESTGARDSFPGNTAY